MACDVRVVNGRVCLSGELNIYAAPQLKETLLAALRANLIDASLDLSQISEIDTAGVQMLIVARRLSQAGGSDIKLINPSDPAREALELCGLSKLIVVEAPTRARRRRSAA